MKAKTRRKREQRKATLKEKDDKGNAWACFWASMERYLDWKLERREKRARDLCICEHKLAEHNKKIDGKDTGSCVLCECTGFLDRNGDALEYAVYGYDPEEARLEKAD